MEITVRLPGISSTYILDITASVFKSESVLQLDTYKNLNQSGESHEAFGCSVKVIQVSYEQSSYFKLFIRFFFLKNKTSTLRNDCISFLETKIGLQKKKYIFLFLSNNFLVGQIKVDQLTALLSEGSLAKFAPTRGTKFILYWLYFTREGPDIIAMYSTKKKVKS